MDGGKVEDLMSEIDIRKANAYKKSDRDNIHKIVNESKGFGRLSELVTSEMRKWIVACAESSLDRMTPDERGISELHLNSMKMYVTLGRLEEADVGLTSRCEKQMLLLGSGSIKVAETMCEIGSLEPSNGSWDSWNPQATFLSRHCKPIALLKSIIWSYWAISTIGWV
jgi:hypothetical protein